MAIKAVMGTRANFILGGVLIETKIRVSADVQPNPVSLLGMGPHDPALITGSSSHAYLVAHWPNHRAESFKVRH